MEPFSHSWQSSCVLQHSYGNSQVHGITIIISYPIDTLLHYIIILLSPLTHYSATGLWISIWQLASAQWPPYLPTRCPAHMMRSLWTWLACVADSIIGASLCIQMSYGLPEVFSTAGKCPLYPSFRVLFTPITFPLFLRSQHSWRN